MNPLLLVLAIFLPHHGYDSPCPCCVLEVFEPTLYEGYDEDCVQEVVDWANQQIEFERAICLSDGNALYDTWSWDLWFCDKWFEDSAWCYDKNGIQLLECAKKLAVCIDLAWLTLYQNLAPVQYRYRSHVDSIIWVAQWQINTYCY